MAQVTLPVPLATRFRKKAFCHFLTNLRPMTVRPSQDSVRQPSTAMHTLEVDTSGFPMSPTDWENSKVAPSYPPNTFTPWFEMHPRRRLHLPGHSSLALPHLVVPIPLAKIEVAGSLRCGPRGKGGSFGRFDCGAAFRGHGLLPTTKRYTTTMRQNTHTKSATKMQRTGTAMIN